MLIFSADLRCANIMEAIQDGKCVILTWEIICYAAQGKIFKMRQMPQRLHCYGELDLSVPMSASVGIVRIE